MTTASPNRSQRFELFQDRSYVSYLVSRLASVLAIECVSVGAQWQIYDITGSPLVLGFLGLTQFLPSLLLVLVAGEVADRFSRRAVMACSMAVIIAGAVTLAGLTLSGVRRADLMFVALTAIGFARAFYNPANRALVINLVKREQMATAIGFNASAGRIATISGALFGGILYGVGAPVPYLTATIFLAGALGLLAFIRKTPRALAVQKVSWSTLSAGAHYVRNNRLLLGAISLDLFAVLLSGATALLPIFARDILHAETFALGLLRAAPSIGGIAMMVVLTWRPITDNAGKLMFVAVGGFGAVTAIFGLSQTIWLSVAMLAAAGAFDMISVIVRETLVQLATPDDMRGRVNAINGVFIGASNELGEVRAGMMAQLMGSAVAAVVIGGIGAIIIAVLWARWFPELRHARRLDTPAPTSVPAPAPMPSSEPAVDVGA